MIELTRLGGPVFALNPDLIERAESTPDTVVTLVNGSKYVIAETLADLIAAIRAYRVELVTAAQAAGSYSPVNPGAYQTGKIGPLRRESTGTGTVVALHPGEA